MTTVEVPHSSRSVVLTVSGVVEETPDSRSLVFDVPADLADKFAYKPGQFLTLRIPSDRTGSVARCYSLASSPFTDDAPKVTVKRTAEGYGPTGSATTSPSATPSRSSPRRECSPPSHWTTTSCCSRQVVASRR